MFSTTHVDHDDEHALPGGFNHYMAVHEGFDSWTWSYADEDDCISEDDCQVCKDREFIERVRETMNMIFGM